jgi:hypothetical protein
VNSVRERLNQQAAAFFDESAVDAVFRPNRVLAHSRFGRTVTVKPANPHLGGYEVRVIPNMTPNLEDVTAFGNTSDTRAGTKAVFKVLHRDVESLPEKTLRRGSFVLDPEGDSPRVFDVLAVNPEYRGGTVFRYTVLVGFE